MYKTYFCSYARLLFCFSHSAPALCGRAFDVCQLLRAMQYWMKDVRVVDVVAKQGDGDRCIPELSQTRLIPQYNCMCLCTVRAFNDGPWVHPAARSWLVRLRWVHSFVCGLMFIKWDSVYVYLLPAKKIDHYHIFNCMFCPHTRKTCSFFMPQHLLKAYLLS
jgi:hypothetical protein